MVRKHWILLIHLFTHQTFIIVPTSFQTKSSKSYKLKILSKPSWDPKVHEISKITHVYYTVKE